MVKPIKDAEELVLVLKESCENDKIVIAEFFAPWCGPCVHLSPQIERFAEEFQANTTFVKVKVQKIMDT